MLGIQFYWPVDRLSRRSIKLRESYLPELEDVDLLRGGPTRNIPQEFSVYSERLRRGLLFVDGMLDFKPRWKRITSSDGSGLDGGIRCSGRNR